MRPASEIPATLRGLVERYSPSGAEGEAVAWLVDHMLESGFDRAYADEAGSAVGLMGSGPRQIVLLGHIDTVPGRIPPRLEDGEYYGRGSVDAKGPLAAFVEAAAAVGRVPGWQIAVIGAAGEEQDSCGARFAVDQFRPEYAVIGEPSRWDRLTLGYKGSARVKVTTRKPLSHTARNEESACEAAFSAWGRVRSWAEVFNRERTSAFDQVFASLQQMESGEDGFEEWAGLEVSLRLPLDLAPGELAQVLRAAVYPASLEAVGEPIPAYRGDKQNPLVRAFLSAARKEGGQPGFLIKTGTADLNIVAPAWGCPAAAYGPGDSNLDHTAEERISLEEYGKAVRVLCRLLKSLTAAPAQES